MPVEKALTPIYRSSILRFFFVANDGVDLSHVARAFYPRVLIDDKVIAK